MREETLKFLSDIPLFLGVHHDGLQALTERMSRKSYPKNTIIISEGDTTNSLFIILSGWVKVFINNETGKELTLTTQGPGEYFGELALLDGGPRSASVMTMEPCEFAMMTRAEFVDFLKHHPDIAVTLIKNLSERIRRLTGKVRDLGLLDVYGRIARTLLELASEENGCLVVTQKLTHQEIANRVGSSREMVSRIMKDLHTGGYLLTENNRLIIQNNLPSNW